LKIKGIGYNELENMPNKSINDLNNNQYQNIYCNESAFCLRLFSIIGGMFNQKYNFTGQGSLLNRQTTGLKNIIIDLGAFCNTNNNLPPFEIQGPYKPNKIKMDGSSGSQILSGLLFTLPLLSGDSEISVYNQKSKPYIDLTINILYNFGISITNENYEHYYIKGNQQFKPGNFIIEGDWSCAAYMLAAGAISGSVKVFGLLNDSCQADKIIIDILRVIGAHTEITNEYISVTNKELKCFEMDASDSPDLFPVLVAIACNCQGKSIIHGIDRLINKESDRASVLLQEFQKLGADISVENNSMIIHGCKLTGGLVDSHNDHRIAMALAVSGLTSAETVTIQNALCVSKSYPDFFRDLKYLMREK